MPGHPHQRRAGAEPELAVEWCGLHACVELEQGDLVVAQALEEPVEDGARVAAAPERRMGGDHLHPSGQSARVGRGCEDGVEQAQRAGSQTAGPRARPPEPNVLRGLPLHQNGAPRSCSVTSPGTAVGFRSTLRSSFRGAGTACPPPDGTRIIVRRERPHPGAQLSLFDQDEGLRHQVFLTDTPIAGGGTAQFLEVRHRGHASVEDHIRTGKDTGFGRFPSRDLHINTVWLELSLTAIDLLAWTRVLLLDGELADAEPKKLRYRLLHVAARLTRGGRRLRLRISAIWPWRNELSAAFHRLAALPRPVG